MFDRDLALADLQANPTDSYRQRSARWGWPVPRIQRLLQSLRKAESVSGVSGVNVTRIGDTPPIHPPDTPCHLDTRVLDNSRCEEGRYTERLIEAMNAELSRIHESYQPVMADNRGSHRAGEAFEAAGIPFDFALQQLLDDCRKYNPSKPYAKGELPKSLAMFTRGVLRAWTRRSQLELGIPPSLSVDRAPSLPAIPNSITRDRNAAQFESSHAPELLGSLIAGYVDGERSRVRK